MTMTKFDYREHFKKDAEGYDELTQSRHIKLIYELEKQMLVGILDRIDSNEKTVMDFACGTGRWTQFIEQHFKETVGVDVSNEMVELAQNKCGKTNFVVTDITQAAVDQQLIGRQFDVITAFRFYKNAQEDLRKSATQAIARYLKDDGLFIFDLHLNTFSFMGILANAIRVSRMQKILKVGDLTVRTISLGLIRKLFCNTPLEIVDYYGMGVLPGRSNCTILPQKMLYKIESFFTKKKVLRRFSYNILIIAKKTGSDKKAWNASV